jgi:hypothetical protein
MSYRLDIPSSLEAQLGALPVEVRRALYGGLYLAADALEKSQGIEAWGERVPDLLPPMYILTCLGHQLLYEVDPLARAVLVRTLALPPGGATGPLSSAG